MKWTITLPRTVAEDDKLSATVEAGTIEEAVTLGAREIRGCSPGIGDVYIVTARVEVIRRPSLPLKSV